MKPGTKIAFKWPLPEGTDFTDEALAGLVGKEARVSVLGTPSGRCRITRAEKAAPRGLETPGAIWIEVEGVEGDQGDEGAMAMIFNLGEGG